MKPKPEWGGHREGAGRKPTWKSGRCKPVKLPVALVDEVIRYARRLDAGETMPAIAAAAEPGEKDSRWAQVGQLVDEKQELQRKLRHLEEALASERKKLQAATTREQAVEQRIADARSVLLYAYQEHRRGVRFRVGDVRSALLALGLDVDEKPGEST